MMVPGSAVVTRPGPPSIPLSSLAGRGAETSSGLWEEGMIRLIAVAFALALATSAQAMPLAPLHQPDGMITQVAAACGAGRTRVNGVCVARTTIRHTRRAVRRY